MALQPAAYHWSQFYSACEWSWCDDGDQSSFLKSINSTKFRKSKQVKVVVIWYSFSSNINKFHCYWRFCKRKYFYECVCGCISVPWSCLALSAMSHFSQSQHNVPFLWNCFAWLKSLSKLSLSSQAKCYSMTNLILRENLFWKNACCGNMKTMSTSRAGSKRDHDSPKEHLSPTGKCDFLVVVFVSCKEHHPEL